VRNEAVAGGRAPRPEARGRRRACGAVGVDRRPQPFAGRLAVGSRWGHDRAGGPRDWWLVACPRRSSRLAVGPGVDRLRGRVSKSAPTPRTWPCGVRRLPS